MKIILEITLIGWSILILLVGAFKWIWTMGVVQSTEFNLQINIVNSLGMILVWLALFTFWFINSNNKTRKDEGKN